MRAALLACAAAASLLAAGCVTSLASYDAGTDAGSDPPTLAEPPDGLDAYRRWNEWARLRRATRTVMVSTHDRSGGNEAADASHFYRRDAAGLSVPLDLAGPGILTFARFNHWHGSPWHFVVDGNETVVTESSTATPDAPVTGSLFDPGDVFASPLARTFTATRGSDLSWVPIPFTTALTLGYGRTHYGTGYFIARVFPEGAPLASWAPAPVPADVADLAGRDAESLVPGWLAEDGVDVDVPASGSVLVRELDGPGRIRALVLDAPFSSVAALAKARLRITWDSRTAPSVDAPVALFFGTGSLVDRRGDGWIVRAFPVSVHFLSDRVRFTTVFPMPFASHARIELVSSGAAAPGIHVALRAEPHVPAPGGEGLFHATYVDHGAPTPGRDLVLLDTVGVEGDDDWCGTFVGTSVIFSDAAVLSTLEGDPRFFFDDAQSPQAQGTGTEEWGGGGDYWGGLTTTLPFVGHPVGAPGPAVAVSPQDEIESVYRYLLADVFPFGKNARIQLEHGALDDSTEHYQSVVTWYGAPRACLVRTDRVDVGDAASEASHAYASPDASAPEMVTSRWDLGPDSLGGVELQPTTTMTGRHTTGTTELTVAVDPANVGVLLRRTLDYAYPDQRADVFVADATPGAAFVHAGVFWSPGSTTCVFSNPPGELDPPDTNLETVDRRLREEELLLPPALTVGRHAIRVRLVFAPTHVPVAPGAPLAPEAFSELRYDVYSYVP